MDFGVDADGDVDSDADGDVFTPAIGEVGVPPGAPYKTRFAAPSNVLIIDVLAPGPWSVLVSLASLHPSTESTDFFRLFPFFPILNNPESRKYYTTEHFNLCAA